MTDTPAARRRARHAVVQQLMAPLVLGFWASVSAAPTPMAPSAAAVEAQSLGISGSQGRQAEGALDAAPPRPAGQALLALASDLGQRLLFNSRQRADYGPLSQEFLTQANLSYCGVASAVMVLNSLTVPAPPAPGYGSYRFWTQDNLLTTAVARAVVAPETVARRGLTLAQLADVLAQPGVTVQRMHGDQLSLAQLRALLRQSLADPTDRLLANYHRSGLGQQGGGHISPLAAYDDRSDRVLVLDVARYRYPSVWVPIPALWRAMRMVDPDSGLSRGLVRLRWSAAEAGMPPPGATPRSAP